MAGYWIAQLEIEDREAYKDYASRAPGIIKSHDGKMLARGGAHVMIVEGV